jgi:hypothetical protein
MKNVLNTIMKVILGEYKFTPTKFNRQSSNSDLFDGWDVFIQDAYRSLSNKAKANEFNKEHQASNYEVEMRSTIAGELFRRTNIHPNLDDIKQIEHEAAMFIDYTRQLAYMVFLYEDKLKQYHKAKNIALQFMQPA